MKVLCVMPGYWPAFQYGGPISSVHALNKALASKGLEVSVYTTDAGLCGKVTVNQEVNIDGVEVTYFRLCKLSQWGGQTGWHLSLALTRALRESVARFDIVYILPVWNYSTAAASYYCRRYRTPYIISPRGSLSSYGVGLHFLKKWPYFHFIAKKDLEGAAAIHYTTEHEAESCHPCLRLNRKTIIIVPNGIDVREFQPAVSKTTLDKKYHFLREKIVLLFLGRIHQIKALDVLAEAYCTLAKDRRDLHLVVAGNGDKKYVDSIKQLICNCGIDYQDFSSTDWRSSARDPGAARVTFTGMLDREERLKVLGMSRIFVLPSYFENFGMAAVEAMAYGVPIIISNNVGIHREVERNRAGLIVMTTPESIYGGIKRLLENASLRKDVAVAGKRLVASSYSVERVADRMIDAYQAVLKRAQSKCRRQTMSK